MQPLGSRGDIPETELPWTLWVTSQPEARCGFQAMRTEGKNTLNMMRQLCQKFVRTDAAWDHEPPTDQKGLQAPLASIRRIGSTGLGIWHRHLGSCCMFWSLVKGCVMDGRLWFGLESARNMVPRPRKRPKEWPLSQNGRVLFWALWRSRSAPRFMKL